MASLNTPTVRWRSRCWSKHIAYLLWGILNMFSRLLRPLSLHLEKWKLIHKNLEAFPSPPHAIRESFSLLRKYKPVDRPRADFCLLHPGLHGFPDALTWTLMSTGNRKRKFGVKRPSRKSKQFQSMKSNTLILNLQPLEETHPVSETWVRETNALFLNPEPKKHVLTLNTKETRFVP